MLSLILADLNAAGFESSFDAQNSMLSVKLASANLESLKAFCSKSLQLIDPIIGNNNNNNDNVNVSSENTRKRRKVGPC